MQNSISAVTPNTELLPYAVALVLGLVLMQIVWTMSRLLAPNPAAYRRYLRKHGRGAARS